MNLLLHPNWISLCEWHMPLYGRTFVMPWWRSGQGQRRAGVCVCVCVCVFRAIGFCPLTHHLRPWWFYYFMLSFNIPFSFLPECFQKARVWLTQTRLPYPKPFQSWHPSAGIRCFIWPSNTWQWGRFGDPSCQKTQVGWWCCQRVADHTSACCWTTNSCQFSVQ